MNRKFMFMKTFCPQGVVCPCPGAIYMYGLGFQRLPLGPANFNAYKTMLDPYNNQRTNGPENAHLKPDPGVINHHEMTLTLNTHTPLLNS